tara:strand:+ start:4909 stop:5157 length:249 start_codon:yes stop_codon:yes gene_type:complete
MKLKPLTYDNAFIGAEVRDITRSPPLLGFIIDIQEYGWAEDENSVLISNSFMIIVKNCDGKSIELDLEELLYDDDVYLVERN